KLLGTEPDREVAGKLGRTADAVGARRVALKMAAFSGRGGVPRKWTEAEEKLLGSESDESIAQKLGRTKTAVALRRGQRRIRLQQREHPRWTAEDDLLLGTMADEELAQRLGR